MKYKVVKTVDIFEKGDMFIKNNDNTYSCEVTEELGNRKYKSTLTISKSYMMEAMAQGIVVLSDEKSKPSRNYDCATCKRLYNELDKLAQQYQDDLDNVQVKHQLGEVSEMQKAETLTVVANLLKLTNHIKSMINNG